MNFYDSFRVIFVIQNIFGLKHYRWNRNSDDLVIDRRLLGISWIIFIIILTSFLTLVAHIIINILGISYRNPIDRGFLTTFIIRMSMVTSVISIFTTWFLSLWNSRKEGKFYRMMKQLDENLIKNINLEIVYQRFYKETKFVAVLLAIPNVAGFILLQFLFEGPIYRASNGILLLFLVQYSCTFVFCFNIRALQMRFDLLQTESKRFLTQKQYMTLINTAKTLTKMLKILNESFCMKQGLILCTNFFNVTTYFYSMFLIFSIEEKTSFHYLFIGTFTKVMGPHLLMMAVVFVMGDFLETKVKVALYALATADNYKLKHLQRRRLFFNLKSVTRDVCILDTVPLNLKLMAKGLNMVAMYFVIILQFNILTENFVM